MTALILTPEEHAYGLAVLILFCLSPFSLANQIHAHWFAQKRISFLAVHCAVLAFTVAFGLLIAEQIAFATSATSLALAAPFGLLAGYAALACDHAIVDRFALRLISTGLRTARGVGPLEPRWRTAFSVWGPADEPMPSVGLLVGGAALEELVYRGLLVDLCFRLPTPLLTGVALLASAAAFAVAHLNYGWLQVLAKLPLGLLALATVLVTGTVLPAVIAHCVFNIAVWRNWRGRPVLQRSAWLDN